MMHSYFLQWIILLFIIIILFYLKNNCLLQWMMHCKKILGFTVNLVVNLVSHHELPKQAPSESSWFETRFTAFTVNLVVNLVLNHELSKSSWFETRFTREFVIRH